MDIVLTEEDYEAWIRETTEEEQMMADILLDLEEGDAIRLDARFMEREIEIYFIREEPGYREIRARWHIDDPHSPPMYLYVVREQFVYIFGDLGWDQDGTLNGLVMGWPENGAAVAPVDGGVRLRLDA